MFLVGSTLDNNACLEKSLPAVKVARLLDPLMLPSRMLAWAARNRLSGWAAAGGPARILEQESCKPLSAMSSMASSPARMSCNHGGLIAG